MSRATFLVSFLPFLLLPSPSSSFQLLTTTSLTRVVGPSYLQGLSEMPIDEGERVLCYGVRFLMSFEQKDLS